MCVVSSFFAVTLERGASICRRLRERGHIRSTGTKPCPHYGVASSASIPEREVGRAQVDAPWKAEPSAPALGADAALSRQFLG